jgi:hypothetical protein
MSRGRHRGAPPHWHSSPDDSPVDDLARFESADSVDDYRHRMIMNAVVFAFTTGLVVAGVWLARGIAHI